MTHLHLVEPDPRGDLFEAELSPAAPLPRGRHGIPADLVDAHQRQRLVAAMSGALAEHGYARVTAEHVSERAGVSSSTFYKHFGNLWECLLAAYEDAGTQLCAEIEASCSESETADVEDGNRADRLADGIEAALAFLDAEPALAQLLGGQPPLEAPSLSAARRNLVERLATLLRQARDPADDTIRPPGLEERLIDAALSFVSVQVTAAGDLTSLAPELTELLAGPRCAA
ncbi:MAG TPA: TetR/AcrR family transcriptional regulator [Solirubrobacterales bacterium]|nr:TetR/AcrR family transcriptional regulator [Solirubrobacterales bacterium]